MFDFLWNLASFMGPTGTTISFIGFLGLIAFAVWKFDAISIWKLKLSSKKKPETEESEDEKEKELEIKTTDIPPYKKRTQTYDWINVRKTAALTIVNGNIIKLKGHWISFDDGEGIDLFSRTIENASFELTVNFVDANILSRFILIILKNQEKKKIRLIFSNDQKEMFDLLSLNKENYPNVEWLNAG